MSTAEIEIEFPPALEGIFEPARTKVFRGGRGGGKSVGAIDRTEDTGR